jgi:hypothetical protein
VNHLVTGKRYVSPKHSFRLYYDNANLKHAGILRAGDVFVLLKVFIPDDGGSVLKVLAPNGTIGWFWTSQQYTGNFLFPMEDSTQ